MESEKDNNRVDVTRARRKFFEGNKPRTNRAVPRSRPKIGWLALTLIPLRLNELFVAPTEQTFPLELIELPFEISYQLYQAF